MKRLLPALLLLLGAAAWAQNGPAKAWNVFTLPNEVVTPSWHNSAPTDCSTNNNYDSCADNYQFWEEWDFANDFSNGIATSFDAVAKEGQYQGVMLLMALGDVTAGLPDYFASNVKFMYKSAAAANNNHGVTIQPVLFPKYKYGAEWCYLYAASAPGSCQIVPGSTTGEALAHQKMVKLMDVTQQLGGCTAPGFAIWYGWSKSEFPYQGRKGQVLRNFWKSLPTKGPLSGCNLQAAYITWLDTGYTNNQDVQATQNYVESLGLPYWVDTELYSQSQIQQGDMLYAPYQTIITGYYGASDITSWAKNMCTKWNWASKPSRLSVWNFFDRDVDPPYEQYKSYINKDMAVVGNICGY